MIKMTAIWVAGLCVLLSLCLGALMGASWTDQVLQLRYRRQAIEWRKLNEWRHALQKTSEHCVWCDNPVFYPPPDRGQHRL